MTWQILFALYADFVMLVAYGYEPFVTLFNRVDIEMEAMNG